MDHGDRDGVLKFLENGQLQDVVKSYVAKEEMSEAEQLLTVGGT